MSLGSRLKTWWRGVARSGQVNTQLEEELQFHIESYAEDLMRGGMTREDAMRRARAELGSVTACRENSRQAWGTRSWDELRADLRYAVRALVKSPGFAAIAVGSLALGVGVNTVIFTAAQHMLLDRLQVSHAEQLRLLGWAEARNGIVEQMWGWFDDLSEGGEKSTSFSYPVYQQLRRENRVLADVFAFKNFGRMTITIDGQAEAADAEMVSGNYYSTLGVRPQLGRGIQKSDDSAAGTGAVVVISDQFWTKRFGRSPEVIGRTVLLNATAMTIVGVNPPGFTGAYSAQNMPDVFFPLGMQPEVAPDNVNPDSPRSMLVNNKMWWVLVMGRVKPGVSDESALASLNVQLNAAVRATMPVKQDSQIPRLFMLDGSRGQNPNLDDLAKPVTVLMGLAGFVLLLACANLANLLLARAGARQREMSVRLALGAGRARIVRQMMTESLLLSVLGGLAGLLLAWSMRNAIPRLLSNGWNPPAFSARFSWQIFLFALGISLLTGLIFGMAPAWQATRVRVSSGLKDTGQTVTQRRRGLAGKAIVVVQVALSMLLIFCAGLFVQTLMRLGHAPLGFRSHNLLLFGIQLPETRYPGTAGLPVLRQVEEKLSAIPGVEGATLIRVPLISGNAANGTFVPEGEHYKREDRPGVLVNDVGLDFFRVFDIPILAGRGFDTTDTPTSRKVAIVNESLVKKFFPNVNPIGRTFMAGWNHPFPMEIVGVCGDTKYYTMRKNAEPTYYALFTQKTNGVTEPTFVVATREEGGAILPSLRDAVRSVDSNLPLLDVRTQDEQIAASVGHERIFANLTAGFGALALVLACIGIYGIMAYAVSQRTNEIGIRMALGARPERVLRMVLGEASRLTACGVAAGLVCALVLGRVVTSLLYGVKANDLPTILASAALLIAVALSASWIPARRAAGVNPMRALRHE
jgi:predicted permease